MRRLRAITIASAILAMAGPARPDVQAPGFLQVLGSVTNSAHPVSNALVIALNLDSFETRETFSATDGHFSLPPLRSGIYKVIALKQGFAPATAMVVPTRIDHRLALRMLSEKQAKGRNVSQEMWEIRGSLPPDVLRDIDMVMAPPPVVMAAADPKYDIPRFRGELTSVTGVADQTAAPAFAQTALGVQSRIGDSWQLGFRGNLHRIEDPSDDRNFGNALAEASAMSMELRSSPTDAVRLASTKSWWRYADDGPTESDREADVRSHNIEWEHGDARVQVRYLGQQNLFRSSPLGSDLIEIAGNTVLLSTGHSDVGVAVRVTQESLRNSANSTYRTADLTANGSTELVPSLIVRYGLTSRVAEEGSEFAPRTGAEWKLTKGTSFVVTALYKVLDQSHPDSTLPMLVVFTDESRVLPRYAYSFGIVSGADSTQKLSAIASVTAIDAPLRVVFNDGFEQFWDGLYVDRGDIRRDLRLAYRREVGDKLAIDVSTSAGMATPQAKSLPGEGEKSYIAADVQSMWQPTGTMLAVSYRHLQQPSQRADGADYRSERVNVRMSQSLHLPLDLRLLLGFEVARADNSPFLLDALQPDGMSRKYVGGLAVNF